MKTTHIIGLVVIAAAIGSIVALQGETSEYVDFEKAAAMSMSGSDGSVHVVGQLPRDENGNIVGVQYDPLEDPNLLVFRLVDEQGAERKVVCTSPPASMQDFEKSEKIVIIGKAKSDHFYAEKILMKCPSKYEETTL